MNNNKIGINNTTTTDKTFFNRNGIKNGYGELLGKVKNIFSSKTKKLEFDNYFEKVTFDPETQELASFHDSHPINSDGTEDMRNLLEGRIKEGFTQLGVFDHNTLVSIYEGNKIIKENNLPIKIINGLEISAGGEIPCHLAFVDFDLEEFSSIFYEKYIIDYKNQRMGEGGFQPSRKNTKNETLQKMELIMEMKRDSAYEYIIFPGDSPEEMFNKLLFHKENGNISKLPIIYIPHPTLAMCKNPRTYKVFKLENNGMTTYGGFFRKKNREKQVEKLKCFIAGAKKIGEDPVIMYEMGNNIYFMGQIENLAASIFENQLKELGIIPVIGPDIHTDMQRKYGFVFPKGKTLREGIIGNSKKLKITESRKIVSTSSNYKIKDIIDHVCFGVRWIMDPLCNEFPNLSGNVDDSLKVYKILNTLDNKDSDNALEWLKQKICTLLWKTVQKIEKLYIPSFSGDLIGEEYGGERIKRIFPENTTKQGIQKIRV